MTQSESVPTKPHVCTWCGKAYSKASRLKRHWLKMPACNINRNANNPTASKYEEPEE